MATMTCKVDRRQYEITALISGGQPRPYAKSLEANLDKAKEQPLRYSPAWQAFEEALSKVDQAQIQGADWDDEEGQAIPLDAAAKAKDFLITTARRSEHLGKAWESPAVSATPDGGIHLSWLVSQNRVSLTFRAFQGQIVCVSKFLGGAAKRELLPATEAVSRVLKAFDAATATPIVASTSHTLR